MTCEPVKLSDGATAIVCPRGRRRRPLCGVSGCVGEGRYQCDFAVGEGKTCDRHLCARHRVAQDPGVDYCPQHARQLDLELAKL